MNHANGRPESHDEPEITQEESVPLDGTDADGEALMKQVRNDRLQQPADEKPRVADVPKRSV